MRPYIDIRFSKRIPGVSTQWVRKVVGKTLAFESARRRGGFVRKAPSDRFSALCGEKRAVSVLLTDDKEIRKINKRFLKHDYATDVISFGTVGAGLKPARTKSGYLGDLVVSVEMAKRVAKKMAISFKKELARYLVHGTLHLLGYNDKKPKDKKVMHRRQEWILDQLCTSRER